MLALGMETHVFNNCIYDYHVSKNFWMPLINEELLCTQEHDPYAVTFS